MATLTDNLPIFSDFGIEIYKRNDVLFINYDAGGIASAMREDIITATEAAQAMLSGNDAYLVLIAIEKRLIASGIDPYVSNI
jgi:hypothetical protein